MRAVVCTRFGGPDDLALRELPGPVPAAGEVLIRVHAASVNSWDVDLVRGSPFYVRLAGGGILAPSMPVLGGDVAGTVEALGDGVADLAVGDAVFGDISNAGRGGFAEFAVAPHGELARKPDGMSFVEAAAIPHAGLLALQGLRDVRAVEPGDRVAIAMRNYPEWLLAYWACTSVGVAAVGMNAWWTGPELVYGIEDSDPRVIIADEERLERLDSQGEVLRGRVLV